MIHRFEKTPATYAQLEAVAEAAAEVLSGEYKDLMGFGMVNPRFLSDDARLKLMRLREALNVAGYEWDELT